MKRITRSISKEVFPNLPIMTYLNELKNILSDCKSVLDIGCGDISPLSYMDIDLVVGVDDHVPTLKIAEKRKTHHELIRCNVTELRKKFKANQFDACVGLDLIEHLPKKLGHQLIKDMEFIARKKIVFFTPNGFLPQFNEENKLQEHQSGWTAKEMQKLGFKVYGMFGHKALRGEYHGLKFSPKVVAGLVSELTHHVYTRNHPEHAAAILCVKTLKK